MMVKLQTFTNVFLNCMEMKVSLTCVPCLGGSFARDSCFQWFADPIMSILDLGKVIFQPVDDLVAWMQGKHLLASSKTCPACNTAMVINSRADVSDGCRYGYQLAIQTLGILNTYKAIN